MEPVRRAVIDIGTNSVKLLVAEVLGRDVKPVLEQSRQTRLGESFYETHLLQPEAVQQSALAVAAFALKARECKAEPIRVIATSAARDARNPELLISAVRAASGLEIEIISGQQEAQWAFQGVTTDSELAALPLMLLEIGGGSTQFILGRGVEMHFTGSFPLGTLRLMQRVPHSNPPRPAELAACYDHVQRLLQAEVRPNLSAAVAEERRRAEGSGAIQLVGSGGTMSILARIELNLADYDRARMEGLRLSADRVGHHLRELWGMPLAMRKTVVGLPPNRADVILPGLVICHAFMREFGFEELRISTRGLRFAAVL
jgi:exopolyphosphatase / guanosine-5'-triphosphate,3'-diphosphate pyrophosphatase